MKAPINNQVDNFGEIAPVSVKKPIDIGGVFPIYYFLGYDLWQCSNEVKGKVILDMIESDID